MTPEYILKASISRIQSGDRWNTPEAALRALDDINWYRDSVNSDTGTKGILVADWNKFPREIAGIVERYGYEIDWHDQSASCDECGKHIHTDAAFYGETPWYTILHDSVTICHECVDAEEYLESLEDDPRKAVNLRGIDPAEHGYERIEGDFENGFHPGQTDDPKAIHARLKERYSRIVFVVDGAGQFDVRFSAWRKI